MDLRGTGFEDVGYIELAQDEISGKHNDGPSVSMIADAILTAE
jgi:hypothetical protein